MRNISKYRNEELIKEMEELKEQKNEVVISQDTELLTKELPLPQGITYVPITQTNILLPTCDVNIGKTLVILKESYQVIIFVLRK